MYSFLLYLYIFVLVLQIDVIAMDIIYLLNIYALFYWLIIYMLRCSGSTILSKPTDVATCGNCLAVHAWNSWASIPSGGRHPIMFSNWLLVNRFMEVQCSRVSRFFQDDGYCWRVQTRRYSARSVMTSSKMSGNPLKTSSSDVRRPGYIIVALILFHIIVYSCFICIIFRRYCGEIPWEGVTHKGCAGGKDLQGGGGVLALVIHHMNPRRMTPTPLHRSQCATLKIQSAHQQLPSPKKLPSTEPRGKMPGKSTLPPV